MDKTPITLVIDAFIHPAPFEADGGPPPVVKTLLSAEARSDLSFDPPIILCAEKDVARARGAFVVSGDGDGRVIGLELAGTAELRHGLVAGGQQVWLAPGETLLDDPTVFEGPHQPSIELLPASLKGVWVPDPSVWRGLCEAEETG